MAGEQLPPEAAREGTGTGNGAGTGSGTRIGNRHRDRAAAAMNIRNARVGGPTGQRGSAGTRREGAGEREGICR